MAADGGGNFRVAVVRRADETDGQFRNAAHCLYVENEGTAAVPLHRAQERQRAGHRGDRRRVGQGGHAVRDGERARPRRPALRRGRGGKIAVRHQLVPVDRVAIDAVQHGLLRADVLPPRRRAEEKFRRRLVNAAGQVLRHRCHRGAFRLRNGQGAGRERCVGHGVFLGAEGADGLVGLRRHTVEFREQRILSVEKRLPQGLADLVRLPA
ncbi:MAG: hypothetical protein KID07_05580, partial [Firmicutes bacterium]|nr:hypothetical protein [Bacillota bacterium]